MRAFWDWLWKVRTPGRPHHSIGALLVTALILVALALLA